MLMMLYPQKKVTARYTFDSERWIYCTLVEAATSSFGICTSQEKKCLTIGRHFYELTKSQKNSSINPMFLQKKCIK